ncbi:DNA polymerase II large subunit [Candidatus Woesearchaeota archaeon]|nr:DNA polymerase II large subunit [Candidatus Woesearchaeota archaeon]
MERYFTDLHAQVEGAYALAAKARKKGYDPEDFVDVPLATNMAERVEGLISAAVPEIRGTNLPQRIQELEQEFGAQDWRVGFKIAEEVAKNRFIPFTNKIKAMETGIRVGFAYLTGGIVSAPLEGFIELRIKPRRDGKEYFSIFYAGPIRGAGGTAAATSVILSDYLRVVMGYAPYDPSDEEVLRYVTEVQDYHERVTNLQYFPSRDEIEYLARHVPVEINGDPTEQIDVSNHKDLQRVETNRIRGGVCLVLAEGLAQKSPKLWKRLSKWGPSIGLEWGFLEGFLELQKKIKARKQTTEKISHRVSKNYTYLTDLVAGRPVLCMPSQPGGFRLRYGRSRTTGFSAMGMHPATQIILNGFIATGTQLKVERPGKAAAITPVDSILGPLVKLKNGSVIHLQYASQARQYLEDIQEIIFLGDLLVNYGDFSENNHPLIPAGYCEEWWALELEKAIIVTFGKLDEKSTSEKAEIPRELIHSFLTTPLQTTPSVRQAATLSHLLGIPLHPAYTHYWKLITINQLKEFLPILTSATREQNGENLKKIILPAKPIVISVLETIGAPYTLSANEFVVLSQNEAQSLDLIFNKYSCAPEKTPPPDTESTLEYINLISSVILRDTAGSFIGARMGRPEKAKMRKLTGSPHVLFPVGEEGGRLRSFQSTFGEQKVKAEFCLFKCMSCNRETVYSVCETCNKKTTHLFFCRQCNMIMEKPICERHGENQGYTTKTINIAYYFDSALKQLGMETFPDLIKGVKGTSNKDHVPENIIKGILRAKHDVYVNKDGTTRYDMSELPLTHFKPKEIGTTLEKLKTLGYEYDIYAQPLTSDDQVLELFPQDLILPSNPDANEEQADNVLMRVAAFVDDLFISLYKQEPYYNISSREDLIGHLVVGLAPHISAGTVGRIIGFSKTAGCYAHPLFHAALRRDCDGDENCVMLLMETLLNFSRRFLPNKRGSRTMDSPLVLTAKIIPSEVDDQAHGVDIAWKYSLDFYEAGLIYKPAGDTPIKQIRTVLGTPEQYRGMGFTHPVSDINIGVRSSAYKTLPTMEDKLKGQMELAEKIRAVDVGEVASAVLQKHFIKDIRGNLRKFSTQQFRCVKCNEKFRRPPLVGKCTKCGGKLLFTVSEGSIVKYLEPSISLAHKYPVPTYVRQNLDLIKRRIEGMFGKESERQEGLGKWFG